MMMLFRLQTKWNQNTYHKTYTLRINKMFKFYPFGIYFLVTTYTNCIVTCSVGWLIWDLTSHQQLRSYGCDKISSIGIKKMNNFLG